MADCVFCKIVAGEFESSKVYEDDSILAFMTIQPVNPGHVLVIPKKHVEYISDLMIKLQAGSLLWQAKLILRSGIPV